MTNGILSSGLIPARFLCMIAHLVILISIFMNRNEFVQQCETSDTKTSTEFDNEIIVALSLSISFLLFELAPFVCGITLLNSFQCFISFILHSSASISLSCMIFYTWCSTNIWPIFAICNCLPMITEFVILLGVWFLKKSIN